MSDSMWDAIKRARAGGGADTSTSQSLVPTGALPTTPVGTVIPNQTALDTTLSTQIAGLVNPGNLFPDTSRQAAELSAARGVPGSAAAYGTGLRMTDEERLSRIALGEQLMSSMAGRNQANVISPTQQATLALQQAQLKLEQEQAQREQEWQNFQRSLQWLNQGSAGSTGASAGATPEGFYRNMYGQLVGQNTGQVGHNYTYAGGGWGW